MLELTFVTLDHEHTPAKWDDWSLYEISPENKARNGKHTPNGVFPRSNERRYSKVRLQLECFERNPGRVREKVPSLKDFFPLHPLHLLEKSSGVTRVEFWFIIIAFFKAMLAQ